MITNKDRKDAVLMTKIWMRDSEGNQLEYLAGIIARIRAEAAEEARKEAADKAVEWVRSKGGYPYDERYEFDIDPETFDDELRAAILKEATE